MNTVDPGSWIQHRTRLLSFCRRELRAFPSERVEEVVQDVLLEAWHKLPTYRAEARFLSFLWAIAAFKCANARRKRQDMLSADGLLEVACEEPSVMGRLADRERDELVETALQRVLDSREQEVAYLRWVLDYPLESIAELLAFPGANEVRVALQRCKRRMQKEIPRLLAERE